MQFRHTIIAVFLWQPIIFPEHGLSRSTRQPQGQETELQYITWQSTLASQSVTKFIMPTTDFWSSLMD